MWASAVAAQGLSSSGLWALEHRLNSCAHNLVAPGLWALPGSGIKLLSSALTGRFFTTEPPWKPCTMSFCVNVASLNDCLSNTLNCFHSYLIVKILSVFQSFFHHQIGLTLYLINPCSLLTFRNSNKCQCLQGLFFFIYFY